MMLFRVSERRPPGRRLEGAGELLRLVRYQIGVANTPDAYETGQVAWLGVARTGSGG